MTVIQTYHTMIKKIQHTIPTGHVYRERNLAWFMTGTFHSQVLVGSHNWSGSGVTLNRDASLIFDDREIAEYYLEAFEIDWARARAPRFEKKVSESVRPAEGDEPRPGFERMTLADYLEG
jgi:phosphatidylserine/phosphatidylglycerophosphate/cardiolipin synthase-like enzyme